MAVKGARIDAYLVCGGKYHDFDFVRLELLKLLAEDGHVRVKVAQDFADTDTIAAADFLVTYTCDVRPTEAEAIALRSWVEGGGRWFALHATNSFFDPPATLGAGLFATPNTNPVFFETVGSQFLSHPALGPYPRHRVAGRRARPHRGGHRAVRRRCDRGAVPLPVRRRGRPAAGDPLDRDHAKAS